MFGSTPWVLYSIWCAWFVHQQQSTVNGFSGLTFISSTRCDYSNGAFVNDDHRSNIFQKKKCSSLALGECFTLGLTRRKRFNSWVVIGALNSGSSSEDLDQEDEMQNVERKTTLEADDESDLRKNEEKRKEESTSESVELANENEEQTPPLPRTIEGGENLVFAMARSLFSWDSSVDPFRSTSISGSSKRTPRSSNLDEEDISMSNNRRNKLSKKKRRRAAAIKEAQSKLLQGDVAVTLPMGILTSSSQLQQVQSSTANMTMTMPPLPRWRPASLRGVSNDNELFRKAPPKMNADGYAGTMRRNSRKRNKPSMWRHALRSYDRLRDLQTQNMDSAVDTKNAIANSDSATEPISGSIPDATMTQPQQPVISLTAAHYEAALVACAKLGYWEKAFSILEDARQQQIQEQQGATKFSTTFQVTEEMVMSLIRACVRGSRRKGVDGQKHDNVELEMEEEEVNARDTFEKARNRREMQRVPLHAARDLIVNLQADFGIKLEPRYVNPLAAAYQSLGFFQDATSLIEDHLSEPQKQKQNKTQHKKKHNKNKSKHYSHHQDDDDEEDDENDSFSPKTLNIHTLHTQNQASYAILVKSAVATDNWSGAVHALQNMTEAGYRPNGRNLHAWHEVSEKKRGGGGGLKTWKKRRDESWMVIRDS